jgi:hypothetical protein
MKQPWRNSNNARKLEYHFMSGLINLSVQHAKGTVPNASGGSDQISVALPYSRTVEGHSGDFPYLSAQALKGTPFGM